MPSQQGMLLDALRGSAPPGALVGVIRFDVSGSLDAAGFQAALDSTIANHPALRAAFIWKGLKVPVQAIQKHVALPVNWLEWEEQDPMHFEARVAERIDHERKKVFDLSAAPLMRCTVIKRSHDAHIVIWIVHHALCDGWSGNILINEVLCRLNGAAFGPDLSLRRYLVWRKRRNQTADLSFWRGYLQHAEPAVELALPDPCPLVQPPPPGPNCVYVPVPKELQELASSCARSMRVTYPNFLAAAFAMTLRRYGAGDDVLFAMTNAGRPSEVPELDKGVGAFLNTLPVRAEIDKNVSVREFVGAFSTDMDKRRSHDTTALSDVLKVSPFRTGRELFRSIFVFEGLPSISTSTGDIGLGNVEVFGPTEDEFALLYHPGGAPKLQIYPPASCARTHSGAIAFGRDFLSIVGQLAQAPDNAVKTVTRAALAADPAPPNDAESYPLILDTIEAQASKTPDALAVISASGTLTYGALTQAAKATAERLRGIGVGQGDIVPIFSPRDLEAIVAMLGAWYCRAAYVALDPSYPEAHNSQILDQIAASVMLVSPSHLNLAPKSVRAEPIDIHARASNISNTRPSGADLAYVLFTSGSTGVPKGVMISHENLAYSTEVRNMVYDRSPTCFLVVSPLAFDSSVPGIYWTLSTGGTLGLADDGAPFDPFSLRQRLRDWSVDHLLCLPSLYRTILEAGSGAPLPSLATVIVAGEALDKSVIRLHRSSGSKARLVNEYGPTEGTVWCSVFDATDHMANEVPIGRAIPGSQIDIVDPDGASLPVGSLGEIVLSGPGVFQGYLNAPDLTGKALIESTHPHHAPIYRTGDLGREGPDGHFYCLGRLDNQVKIRGKRVELSEVEAAILATRLCETTAVIAVLKETTTRILAFVQSAEYEQADRIRNMITARLPSHMIPDQVIALPDWPKLPNGKTDRKALQDLAAVSDETQPRYGTAPEGFIEETLAAIWKECLGLTEVWCEDDFFDRGGDSLKSIQVVLEAERAGIRIDPFEVFDHPTLGGLSRHVAGRNEEIGPKDLAGQAALIRPKAADKTFIMVHGSHKMCARLARSIGSDNALFYYFSAHVRGSLPSPSIVDEARTIADQLVVARPNGPVVVGGYSAGGQIAVEVARILQARGRAVDGLFLLDPSWEFARALGKGGQTVRPIPPAQLYLVKALTVARIAAAKLANWLQPGNTAARATLIAQLTRRALLRHTIRPTSIKTTIYSSKEAYQRGLHDQWDDVVFSDLLVVPSTHDHLGLQSDDAALFDWTSRMAKQFVPRT